MFSCSEVFQRVEKKYRVSAWQRRAIEGRLRAAMEPDAYGLARVTSLYWDTPDRALISRSLEKPLYKEKLRVRAYGREEGEALVRMFLRAGRGECVSGSMSSVGGAGFSGFASGIDPLDGSVFSNGGDPSSLGDPADPATFPVFVELKKKYKGVVYKRRTGMSLAAARAYLGGADYRRACERFPLADPALAEASLEPRSVQIAAEIDVMRERYKALAPSMAIACDRVAWRPRAECADELGELRVTFDAALRFAERCNVWRSTIGEAESIMEIKSAGPFPLWLAETLNAARAYPTSFSKYGTAAQIACAGKRARPLRAQAPDGAHPMRPAHPADSAHSAQPNATYLKGQHCA